MRRKHRLIAILLLAVILVLTASSLVLAADPLLNNSTIQNYNELNKPSYGEKFLAGIIIGPVKWLMNIFSLDDPVLLVFNQNPRKGESDTFLAKGVYGSSTDQIVLGIFPQPFFDAVSILYTAFEKLLPIPLVLILVIMAIMHMINSGSTEGRNKIKDYTQAFVVALAAVRFGAYIWTAIISLTQFFVKLIWAYMLQAGIRPGFFMDMIWGVGIAGFNGSTNSGTLALAIIILLAALMVLSLNYQYVMRLIILGLLIILFPIVATLSIYPGYRHSLQMWLKEFVANVILPLAHALALGAFFLTMNMKGLSSGLSFWLPLVYFAGLPAITVLIRELLGLQGGGGNKVLGAMAGMAGLAALMSMGKMVTRSKPSGGKGHDTVLSDDADSGGGPILLTGATSRIGKAAQGTFNVARSMAGNKLVQSVAGGAGRGALGVTAAAAGATLSAMTGGSAATGAMLGAKSGAAMAKGVSSVAGGARTITQAVASGASNLMARSMENGGVLANANWGLQAATNKISGGLGGSEVFPNAGHFKENLDTLRTAKDGLREVKPDVAEAKDLFNNAKANLDPQSEEYQAAMSRYANLHEKQRMLKTDQLLAQTKLRSPSEFSASRGKLD